MGNLPMNHLRNDTFEAQFATVMGLSNDYLTICLDAYRICKTCQIAMMSLYEGKKYLLYIKAECVCSGWHESTILLMIQKSCSTWDGAKTLSIIMRKNYQRQLVLSGFLNHQQC